jgi:hypothetical protein
VEAPHIDPIDVDILQVEGKCNGFDRVGIGHTGPVTTFIVVVLLVVLRWWGSIIIWPVLFIALIVGLVPVPVRWARRWLPWLMAALSRVAVALLLRRVLVVVVVLTRHCGKITGLSNRAVALTSHFRSFLIFKAWQGESWAERLR